MCATVTARLQIDEREGYRHHCAGLMPAFDRCAGGLPATLAGRQHRLARAKLTNLEGAR